MDYSPHFSCNICKFGTVLKKWLIASNLSQFISVRKLFIAGVQKSNILILLKLYFVALHEQIEQPRRPRCCFSSLSLFKLSHRFIRVPLLVCTQLFTSDDVKEEQEVELVKNIRTG